MKRIVLLIAIMLPIVAFAQQKTAAKPQSKQVTYDDIMSAPGICTTYKYSLGSAEMSWKDYTRTISSKLNFHVIKYEVGSISVPYIYISRDYSGETVMINVSEAKKLIKAIDDIKLKSTIEKPVGADVTISYNASSDFTIQYKNAWTFYFDKLLKVGTSTDSTDSFVSKLQEAITKCEDIK